MVAGFIAVFFCLCLYIREDVISIFKRCLDGFVEFSDEALNSVSCSKAEEGGIPAMHRKMCCFVLTIGVNMTKYQIHALPPLLIFDEFAS